MTHKPQINVGVSYFSQLDIQSESLLDFQEMTDASRTPSGWNCCLFGNNVPDVFYLWTTLPLSIVPWQFGSIIMIIVTISPQQGYNLMAPIQILQVWDIFTFSCN